MSQIKAIILKLYQQINQLEATTRARENHYNLYHYEAKSKENSRY